MSNPTTEPPLPVLVQGLPSALARTIDSLAEKRGQDRVQFIVSFLQEQLDRPAPSFDQMMAPIADDFRRSGMTEEDLDALVEQERQAMWDENKGQLKLARIVFTLAAVWGFIVTLPLLLSVRRDWSAESARDKPPGVLLRLCRRDLYMAGRFSFDRKRPAAVSTDYDTGNTGKGVLRPVNHGPALPAQDIGLPGCSVFVRSDPGDPFSRRVLQNEIHE